MIDASADFASSSLSGPVHTDPTVIEMATKNLQRFHDEGKLPDLPGWEGDQFEGWLDLLGLNGRPIKQNRPVGLKS